MEIAEFVPGVKFGTDGKISLRLSGDVFDPRTIEISPKIRARANMAIFIRADDIANIDRDIVKDLEKNAADKVDPWGKTYVYCHSYEKNYSMLLLESIFPGATITNITETNPQEIIKNIAIAHCEFAPLTIFYLFGKAENMCDIRSKIALISARNIIVHEEQKYANILFAQLYKQLILDFNSPAMLLFKSCWVKYIITNGMDSESINNLLRMGFVTPLDNTKAGVKKCLRMTANLLGFDYIRGVNGDIFAKVAKFRKVILHARWLKVVARKNNAIALNYTATVAKLEGVINMWIPATYCAENLLIFDAIYLHKCGVADLWVDCEYIRDLLASANIKCSLL